MAGQIRSMIDQIIEKRSNGNAVLASTTQTKLILKGIDPAKYDANSQDDPQVIARLRELAAELSINL
jgi:ribosomal protein L18